MTENFENKDRGPSEFSGKEIKELKLNRDGQGAEFNLKLVEIAMFLVNADKDNERLSEEKAKAKNMTDKELIKYVEDFSSEDESIDLEKCIAIDLEIKKRTDLAPKKKELKF